MGRDRELKYRDAIGQCHEESLAIDQAARAYVESTKTIEDFKGEVAVYYHKLKGLWDKIDGEEDLERLFLRFGKAVAQ